MAIKQPTGADKLNSPDHSLSHRVFANDEAAPVKKAVVDSLGDIYLGDYDGSNRVKIASATGFMTLEGNAQGKLNLRPTLVNTTGRLTDEPTEVTRGLNVGYSMYKWAASPTAASQQELSFRMRIPKRWDGTTDPQLGACVTLAGAEDVGDKFKFQLDWQTTNAGNVMGTTVSTCYSEQTVLTGRNEAYDTYFIFFTYDASDVNNPIIMGEMLQSRLRLISASSNEVSNEIIVWDWSTMWKVANVYGAFSVDTNAS